MCIHLCVAGRGETPERPEEDTVQAEVLWEPRGKRRQNLGPENLGTRRLADGKPQIVYG